MPTMSFSRVNGAEAESESDSEPCNHLMNCCSLLKLTSVNVGGLLLIPNMVLLCLFIFMASSIRLMTSNVVSRTEGVFPVSNSIPVSHGFHV